MNKTQQPTFNLNKSLKKVSSKSKPKLEIGEPYRILIF